MKYIKLYEELINEIGDASSKPYKWKWMGRTFEYAEFTTDSGIRYEVSMYREEDYTQMDTYEIMRIEYGVETISGQLSYTQLTNEGELYKVMATVTDIVKTALKKHTDVKQLEFSGSKDKGVDDQRRNKLYTAYVKRQLKAKDIWSDGNTITVEL